MSCQGKYGRCLTKLSFVVCHSSPTSKLYQEFNRQNDETEFSHTRAIEIDFHKHQSASCCSGSRCGLASHMHQAVDSAPCKVCSVKSDCSLIAPGPISLGPQSPAVRTMRQSRPRGPNRRGPNCRLTEPWRPSWPWGPDRRRRVKIVRGSLILEANGQNTFENSGEKSNRNPIIDRCVDICQLFILNMVSRGYTFGDTNFEFLVVVGYIEFYLYIYVFAKDCTMLLSQCKWCN